MDVTIAYQSHSDFILKKMALDSTVFDIKKKLFEIHGFPID
jgi:hypothetical protein